MSDTTVQPAEGAADTGSGRAPPRWAIWRDPVATAIAAAALLALALRAYQLARPGYLLGLTEYDDGPYFGSALRLVSGSLPYRDFVLVQPPGITLLMAPAALAGKAAGTAAAMAAGRVLTALASAAGVVLLGLLVRHRGLLATVVACGVLAVYPDGVAAAHTVLVEPWLVLFCLAGALAVFDRDRMAGGWRLLAGGAAFGFAGVVEAWAIVPALAVFLLLLRPLRRAAVFAAGLAAGFGVPVLPFAALSPRGFYESLITAQIGPRAAVSRVPLWLRLKEMTGLSDLALPRSVTYGNAYLPVRDRPVVVAAVAVLVLLIVGGLAAVVVVRRRRPLPLEVFALATTVAVAVMFCWPSQFHYHFCAFLAPFLGLAVALPVSALAAPAGRASGPPGGTGWRAAFRAPAASVTAVAVLIVAIFAVLQARAEAPLRPVLTPATISAVQRQIPPGACVVTDEVSLVILADRFVSGSRGCSPVLDGLGTDLALSGGRKPSTGAGRVPAVAAVWHQAFAHAQFAVLSRYNARRVAWSPALESYFRAHFARVWADGRGDALYRRQAPARG